ncbi:MAG: decaprenyl-phosphate phosphoribosyltransferase [Alicyclobacillaceae bacterium]|nr:decaprenyl-phosphate phosphoribosyltransferase [Alicyclobacillaceae bacterium]
MRRRPVRRLVQLGVDLIALMRPRQWVKNVFVLAPVFFSGRMGNPASMLRAVEAALAFCLMSGAVYSFNDLVDRERDRLHPRKRHRPLAAGRIRPAWAVSFSLVLAALSASAALAASREAAAVLALYGAMNMLYSFGLKQYVLIDVFLIAFGFVLRVVAGAVAIPVPPSPWLLLTTFLLAMFLGFCKRRAELAALEDRAQEHRRNLEAYSRDLLDQFISISAAATVMTYSMYTFSRPEGPLAMITVPFVVYSLFRYLYRVRRDGEGESPEKILFQDKPFLISGLLWVAASFVVVYLHL